MTDEARSGRLVYLGSVADRLFKDRREAGRVLAGLLERYRDRADVVVLGLPRGGAPVGELIPMALHAMDRGGTVVCGGIHMSDIPSFPYSILWGERVLRSVANLTRADGVEFLALAPTIPIETHVTVYPLEKANEALDDLREGRLRGSAVLAMA